MNLPNGTAELSFADKVRFYSNIERHWTGCFIWKSAVSKQTGYGAFRLKGKTKTAHRVSWILANGPVPNDLQVLHKCDVRRCVNPEHLFLGTQKDNVHDAIVKGRYGTPEEQSARAIKSVCRGDEHYSRKRPEIVRRGDKCSWSKLTEKDVNSIRNRYAAGGILQRELAEEYGVHHVTISAIILGKSWNSGPTPKTVMVGTG